MQGVPHSQEGKPAFFISPHRMSKGTLFTGSERGGPIKEKGLPWHHSLRLWMTKVKVSSCHGPLRGPAYETSRTEKSPRRLIQATTGTVSWDALQAFRFRP